MAYIKNVWQDGETIATAERMNHIEDGIADLYNAIFPIGQIVIKGDNEDYSNWLGFTWERTAVGKVLVGYDSNDSDFNSIGKIGGEKTHTLTVEEMPIHAHSMEGVRRWVGDENGDTKWPEDGTYQHAKENMPTAYTGGNQPHNNVQPYQVVAYWRRIS